MGFLCYSAALSSALSSVVSAARKAWMVSSLRLKKCHCPAFWLLIKPARCKVARWADTVDWDRPQRWSICPAQTPYCVVVQLLGELHFRVFEPGEDVSPYRVRQGFYYFVEVEGHGRGAQ